MVRSRLNSQSEPESSNSHSNSSSNGRSNATTTTSALTDTPTTTTSSNGNGNHSNSSSAVKVEAQSPIVTASATTTTATTTTTTTTTTTATTTTAGTISAALSHPQAAGVAEAGLVYSNNMDPAALQPATPPPPPGSIPAASTAVLARAGLVPAKITAIAAVVGTPDANRTISVYGRAPPVLLVPTVKADARVLRSNVREFAESTARRSAEAGAPAEQAPLTAAEPASPLPTPRSRHIKTTEQPIAAMQAQETRLNHEHSNGKLLETSTALAASNYMSHPIPAASDTTANSKESLQSIPNQQLQPSSSSSSSLSSSSASSSATPLVVPPRTSAEPPADGEPAAAKKPRMTNSKWWGLDPTLTPEQANEPRRLRDRSTISQPSHLRAYDTSAASENGKVVPPSMSHIPTEIVPTDNNNNNNNNNSDHSHPLPDEPGQSEGSDEDDSESEEDVRPFRRLEFAALGSAHLPDFFLQPRPYGFLDELKVETRIDEPEIAIPTWRRLASEPTGRKAAGTSSKSFPELSALLQSEDASDEDMSDAAFDNRHHKAEFQEKRGKRWERERAAKQKLVQRHASQFHLNLLDNSVFASTLKHVAPKRNVDSSRVHVHNGHEVAVVKAGGAGFSRSAVPPLLDDSRVDSAPATPPLSAPSPAAPTPHAPTPQAIAPAPRPTSPPPALPCGCSFSFFPPLADITYIDITDDLPLVAFGCPLPQMDKSRAFSLPDKDTMASLASVEPGSASPNNDDADDNTLASPASAAIRLAPAQAASNSLPLKRRHLEVSSSVPPSSSSRPLRSSSRLRSSNSSSMETDAGSGLQSLDTPSAESAATTPTVPSANDDTGVQTRKRLRLAPQ
ncbi:hypothetical protein CAOG_06844 [Capsaspora owczarzaki ATCC 30864]|uniref:PEHE domain-containing protein n=1 Tax=Capsaspora owczarzaki (strain ATCC 30864) TaxID=595528 RepID=A0A0D2VXY6_CAPO3|nr:hypothetical protein CAOG_06844 [Capsaspora owczarzaki ATCC 30864]KJE96537.1 hypothetical protein CAOG_006844 [Capsaspora owczarzaki ATCC 30864]|eukprot:XP_004344465.1 hypothetical protein CAOG_06844 [Capsaspora owczarzaki ATCC 30864]